MKIVGMTDIGCVRKENQDNFRHMSKGTRSLALVCDGMGGPKGGAIASRFTTELIFGKLEPLLDKIGADEFKRIFSAAVTEANEELIKMADKDKMYKGMGTTAVAAFICGKTCVIANVGDSRAYHFSNDRLKQISHDHSMVQELVDDGTITEAAARNHPNKNIITRAVGAYNDVNVDYFETALNDDSVIMLCSDGLTNMLDDNEILFEMDTCASLEKCAETLVDMAKKKGGKDNITILFAAAGKDDLYD